MSGAADMPKWREPFAGCPGAAQELADYDALVTDGGDPPSHCNGVTGLAFWSIGIPKHLHHIGGKPALVRPTTGKSADADWQKHVVMHPGIIEQFWVDGVEYPDGTCPEYMEECFKWQCKNVPGFQLKAARP